MLLSFQRYLADTPENADSDFLMLLIEQLKLSSYKSEGRRYSPELVVRAFILYSSSRACYERLLEQGLFYMPSVKTLRRIMSKLDGSTSQETKEYIKMRTKSMNEYDINVILMIDEIYIASRPESTGGRVSGLTEDGETANTALCFMVRSLTSKYRDIIGIYPIKTLTSDALNDYYIDVMRLLYEVGLNVVAILVDNHPVNRRFFLYNLCAGEWKPYIQNPFTGNKVYLVFDPTHNIKNLYNNLLSRKIFECPSYEMIFEKETKLCYDDVRSVYEMETTKPLKLAHKLDLTVLQPHNLQKTSVKLADSFFHESTINALITYGYRDSADVLTVFRKVWDILNVKTTSAGFHKRNFNKEPITHLNDPKMIYLRKFREFLLKWKDSRVSWICIQLHLVFSL